MYQVGVDDDGTPIGLTKPELEESLRNMSYMAEVAGCSLTVTQVLAGMNITIVRYSILHEGGHQILNPLTESSFMHVHVALV